ncbi:hypothetical protein ACFW04_008271 [Cataglyphis niger]
MSKKILIFNFHFLLSFLYQLLHQQLQYLQSKQEQEQQQQLSPPPEKMNQDGIIFIIFFLFLKY